MFSRESQMATPAARWMMSQGLTVREEFTTPWGVCDLVGLEFNKAHVAHRIALGQRRSVSSISRASLLLDIPDVETGRCISTARLLKRHAVDSNPAKIQECIERLIADKFVLRTRRGSLQKLTGWMPIQNRVVAVELKLSRIDEAMRQAANNAGFADESYVALPASVALRVAAKRSRWADYFSCGIGVLAVFEHRCEVVVAALQIVPAKPSPLRVYLAEKFWRNHVKDSRA